MDVPTNDFDYLKDAENPIGEDAIETIVFEGKTTHSYVLFKNDKVIFETRSDFDYSTGPVQFNFHRLKKAIKDHERKIRNREKK
jgi:hypothetical protein